MRKIAFVYHRKWSFESLSNSLLNYKFNIFDSINLLFDHNHHNNVRLVTWLSRPNLPSLVDPTLFLKKWIFCVQIWKYDKWNVIWLVHKNKYFHNHFIELPTQIKVAGADLSYPNVLSRSNCYCTKKLWKFNLITFLIIVWSFGTWP